MNDDVQIDLKRFEALARDSYQICLNAVKEENDQETIAETLRDSGLESLDEMELELVRISRNYFDQFYSNMPIEVVFSLTSKQNANFDGTYSVYFTGEGEYLDDFLYW